MHRRSDHVRVAQSFASPARSPRAKELEAFRTMSAFFVHDLKNAAASLNLTLKNLPVHFDDPSFRQDALRAIGNTAQRIDDMIARLSELRQRPADADRVDTDLNQLVTNTLAERRAVYLASNWSASCSRYRPSSPIASNCKAFVTNFVLNARDAVGSGGRIDVRTEHRASRVVLSVVDNGCGMSAAFVQGFSVQAVPEHQEERAGPRPVSIALDRAGAWRHHARRERNRQRHVDSREFPGRRDTMSKPKLLLVEDDEDIRTQMKWALASDYDVSTAGDGAEAMAAFSSNRPIVTLARSRSAAASKRIRGRPGHAVSAVSVGSVKQGDHRLRPG